MTKSEQIYNKILTLLTQTPPIGKLFVLSLLIMFGLSGCALSPYSAGSKTLSLYKNGQLEDVYSQYSKQYSKAYIVGPPDDSLNVAHQFQQELISRGIETERYQSHQFFSPQGSGFFIAKEGFLLTCNHVVAQQDEVRLNYNGQTTVARVLFRDQAMDLALLKTDHQGPWPVIRFSASPHRFGEPVFALGYPLSALLGKSPRLTQGIVNATAGFNDDPGQFQISAPIQPGNSGGAILNSRGQLVGIAQSTLNSAQTESFTGGVLPQNVNFAVKQRLILNFLQAATDTNHLPKAILARIASPAEQETSFIEAASASVLISGAPQSLEEALVIAVDYTVNPLLHPQNDSAQFFTVTLYDFRSKQPMLKMTQINQTTPLNTLVDASLLEVNQFLAPRQLTSATQPQTSTAPAMSDQLTTQFVAAEESSSRPAHR